MSKHPDWFRLGQNPNTPLYVDFPVIARHLRDRSRESQIVVDLFTEEGERYSRAYIFPQEWYPGAEYCPRYSHYFYCLRAIFDGLKALGEEEEIRLQILKAIYLPPTAERRGLIVLLKFLLTPEYAIEGSGLETTYQCPLRTYLEGFIGLSRSVLKTSESVDWTAGKAIHQGYQKVTEGYLSFFSSSSTPNLEEVYYNAVWRAWREDFVPLLRKLPQKGRPLAHHKLPLQAFKRVIDRSQEKISSLAKTSPQSFSQDSPSLHLYHERFLYTPNRGLSGKTDQVIFAPKGAYLTEIKTRISRGGLEVKDPWTGREVPGGLQALIYQEILRQTTHVQQTSIEIFYKEGSEVTCEEILLEQHPLFSRCKSHPSDSSFNKDRYLDLMAQNRNVGFIAESGLLTGYDRERIAEVIETNRFLQPLNLNYDYVARLAPCSVCPAQQRGICPHAYQYYDAPLWPQFFRHIPESLYQYWAYFHYLLTQEIRHLRENLYRLFTTDLAQLEAEGTSIGGLHLVSTEENRVTLQRDRPLETRLREGDQVLLTPEYSPSDFLAQIRGNPPKASPSSEEGETPPEIMPLFLSIEGEIETLETYKIILKVKDTNLPPAETYRVDQFFHLSLARWQIQGLTDFLVSSMVAVSSRGRRVSEKELPPLTQLLLGIEGSSSPTRVSPSLAEENPGSSADEEVSRFTAKLNPEQLEILRRVLTLPKGELLLIQGPPGTGKTHLVACIIEALINQQKTISTSEEVPVLVLTNTHRAANEVVKKLHQLWRKENPSNEEIRPDLIRIGPPRPGWEPEVRQYTLIERLKVTQRLPPPPYGEEEWEAFIALLYEGDSLLKKAKIFIGTLGSAQAEELRGRCFTYTIVDEAGQATEPATLQAFRHLPLGYAGRLILVGDHQQLPPVVEGWNPNPLKFKRPLTPALKKAGFREGDTLQTSLFERLARLYPHRLFLLEKQYRMNEPICTLVSQTFYEGRLQPGQPEIASAQLEKWLQEVGGILLGEKDWGEIWSPRYAIVFLCTDEDPHAKDQGEAESRCNHREAQLIAQILGNLLQKIPEDRRPLVEEGVGVLSAYRKQNNLIRQYLEEMGIGRNLRVDTVDRFQGGQKPVMCISLVNHNPEGSIGPLHSDPRRFNVALSRAQYKLILVGSRQTFTRLRGDTEDSAKKKYLQLFQLIEQMAETGKALILSTKGL